MRINASLFSHPGLVREKNEDNFLFFGTLLESLTEPIHLKGDTLLDHPVVFGVFDGMGGISAGEIASQIAASTSKTVFSLTSGNDANYEEVLLDICNKSNDAICAEMNNTVKKRMGSTASMLCFFQDEFVLCNIGDSPIFILRNSRLIEISKEHTEKENYEKVYGTSNEHRKFKLTQHLGIFPEEMIIEPNIAPGQAKENDRFLICSDGLTDMVSLKEIETLLCEGLPATETANRLQQKALNYGGKDNITIVCIDIVA